MFDATDLTERLREAAAVDLSGASDDDLLAAAVELQRARAAFDAAEAHVLAELDVRGSCDRRYGHPTGRWVASQTRGSSRSIGRRVRTGRWLRQLPQVDAALSDGAIGVDHAILLAEAVANPRIAEPVVAAQEPLVDYARQAPFRAFQAQMREMVHRWDQDSGFDPNRELARNRVHLSEQPDGVLSVKGELVGEHALVLRQALEREADRQFRHRKRDHDVAGDDLPIPPRATLMALGLVELIRTGLAREPGDTRAPISDISLVVTAVEGAAIPAVPTGRPVSSSDVPIASSAAPPGSADPAVHRITRHQTHGRAAPDTDGCCEPPGMFDDVTTPDGDPVVADTVRHLLCDPRYVALVMSTLGVPLDVGRDARRPNRAQRRALARRDGGCVFPGCDAPASWCDAHHIIHWEHGGPTDLWNLALLCRHHHGVTHRNGWTMASTSDQRFTWTTPAGDTLHSQRNRGRPGPPDRSGARRPTFTTAA